MSQQIIALTEWGQKPNHETMNTRQSFCSRKIPGKRLFGPRIAASNLPAWVTPPQALGPTLPVPPAGVLVSATANAKTGATLCSPEKDKGVPPQLGIMVVDAHHTSASITKYTSNIRILLKPELPRHLSV